MELSEKRPYQIVVGSPVDYEELTVDIVFDDGYAVLVQKEEGNDKMIVEFYGNERNYKIYFDEFIVALQEARSELMK